MYKTPFSMFNLPNLVTASNLLCGIFSIMLSLHGRIDLAPYPLFLGLIFDYFDGFLARLLKQQGELGKQLDSLADVVTFGVAPGIMMLVLLVFSTQQFSSHDVLIPENLRAQFSDWFQQVLQWGDFSWIPFAALLIPLMSMFRLAKFNIDTRQSDSFIGLPTPANSIFFTAFPLLMYAGYSPYSWQNELIYNLIHPAVLLPVILVMSFLLIAEIPLFALKFKHFHFRGNEIRYLFLITCSLLIPICMVWSIPIIVILYLILSVTDTLLKKSEA